MKLRGRGFKYDVFISYSRHDGKIDKRMETLVDIVKQKVLARGVTDFNFFIDTEDIPYGEVFKHVILQAIKQSQILVPIVTESYLRSRYCQFEFDEFHKQLKKDQQRKVIPILWNDNGIHTCANTEFYKNLFELNMLRFTEPHPVRKEINKNPISDEVEKAVAILADTISSILCPIRK